MLYVIYSYLISIKYQTYFFVLKYTCMHFYILKFQMKIFLYSNIYKIDNISYIVEPNRIKIQTIRAKQKYSL